MKDNININILVVDDDPAIIKKAWRVLSHEGYSVEGVLSAKEAMHRIKQKNYALVFTDLTIPEIDGISFIKSIKQSQPAIGIVVITDYVSEETIKEAHKLGIISHMRKPLTTAILKDVTNRAIEWIRVNASENETEEEFPPAKLEELDKVVNQYRKEPGSTIRVLLYAQEILGYLPSWIQQRIAKGLNIFPSEICSIVSFYHCFRTKPEGDHVPCYINGSERVWRGMSWRTGRRVANVLDKYIK
ncbi:MAG: response regulator [Candidatus Aenigmarchaeota archaeon]|nr:response regulator [Candidatus Aenigmarchaeota archaeon]